jgi:hypothetical protein
MVFWVRMTKYYPANSRRGREKHPVCFLDVPAHLARGLLNVSEWHGKGLHRLPFDLGTLLPPGVLNGLDGIALQIYPRGLGKCVYAIFFRGPKAVEMPA